MSKNCDAIINSDVCTRCGACVGVCPVERYGISFDKDERCWIKTINYRKCMDCAKCFEVCPVVVARDPKEKRIAQYIFGNCAVFYKGFATDAQLRFESSSGGVLTALLINLLENGVINGALVVKFDDKLPARPVPFLARNKEEVLRASGSKYQPVPLLMALKEVRTLKRVAMVGLPCHMRALERVMAQDEDLKSRIYIRLGLFCSHVVEASGLNFLAGRRGIKNICQVRYSGMGWPGKMEINSDAFDFRPVWENIFGSYLFAPVYCLHCTDFFSEASDISFGDAWLKREVQKNNPGLSLMIVRNALGMKALERLKEQALVRLDEASSDDLVYAQGWPLYLKKKNIGVLGRQKDLQCFQKKTFIDLLVGVILRMNVRMSGIPCIRGILFYLPDVFFLCYCRMVKRLIMMGTNKFFIRCRMYADTD